MRRRGFTIIELLVIIAILCILFCLFIPALRKASSQGEEKAAQQEPEKAGEVQDQERAKDYSPSW